MEKKDLDELKIKISQLDINEQKLRDLYLRDLSLGLIQGPMTGYAPIDRPWLKYYDFENKDMTIPNKSIYQYALECNKDRMNMPAIDLRMSSNNFGKPIRKLNYYEYFDEIVTIACGLMEYGIKPNEKILAMLPNLIESRESIYACSAIGATPYPITPMLPEITVDKIISENKIENVIMFGGFYEKFKTQLDNDCIRQIIYLNGLESLNPILRSVVSSLEHLKGKGTYDIPKDDRIITWDKILKAGKSYRKKNNIKTIYDFKPYYEPNHLAVIVGTSGTTGIPKGACLSDNALNAVSVAQINADNYDAGETNLDALIQSIAYGVSVMHYSTCGGINNYLIPELITDRFPSILAKLKPDHFAGGPVHYDNLAKSEEFKNGEIKKSRNLISGGASLSKKTESVLNSASEGYVESDDDENHIYVRQGLGATENCGVGTYAKKGSYKFGGLGVPIMLENIGIFKPGTDEELSYNEEGEICISGPTIMNEYFNNETETSKVLKIHSDGTKWLHLSDLGYMDNDGQLFMIDRLKNIFMRTGFNVHPSKITEFISSIPVVEKCTVVGVAHPDEVCVPVAFVVLKSNLNTSLEKVKELLENLCYKNLDEYSLPYEWVFVEDLPINLGGKIDTKKLISDAKIDYFVNDGKSVKKMNLR